MARSSALVAPGTAIPQLGRLGLSTGADLVYRSLVEFGPQLVGELARTLGMPPRRVREALDELADVGAAHPGRRRHARRANAWLAAEPGVVAAELRARRVDAARARHRLRSELAGLSALGVPLDMARVRVLHGGTRIQARLAELIARERQDHLVLSTEPAFSVESVRAAAPLTRLMCERGVSIRHVGVPAIAGDASGAIADELASGGALYRELPAVPTKLMIFDRTTALVPLNPGDVGRGAFETSEPSTVHALIDVFFNQWEQAREPRTESMDMELNPREEAIVRLLAAGHTDAGVAAELKLSARTIAYTLRGLMDRYGVQNRFQLGLVLGPLAARHVLGPSQTSDTNGDTE